MAFFRTRKDGGKMQDKQELLKMAIPLKFKDFRKVVRALKKIGIKKFTVYIPVGNISKNVGN